MHIELLVGDIVRQTTVLVAQLSTAAGLRAPLAKIADQVFLDLAKELEAQGIRKKVAADMFGLALRTYQIKVRRLGQSQDQEQATLWQSIYDRLEHSSRTREELEADFCREEPSLVAATLQDMVQSGVAYCSGRGGRTLFGLTNPDDRARLGRLDRSIDSMVWYLVATDAARTSAELQAALGCSPRELEVALSVLLDEGRLERTDDRYVAHRLEIPVGAEKGWEVAVCDHYRAVTSAIAAKVARATDEVSNIGGGTVSYRISPHHPLRDEVLAQLDAVRCQVNELWRRVADHNDEHGVGEPVSRVTFYFGQNVVEHDELGKQCEETKDEKGREVR